MNTPGHFTDLCERIQGEYELLNRRIRQEKKERIALEHEVISLSHELTRLRKSLMWVSDESKERRVRSFASKALNYHGQGGVLDGIKQMRETIGAEENNR